MNMMPKTIKTYFGANVKTEPAVWRESLDEARFKQTLARAEIQAFGEGRKRLSEHELKINMEISLSKIEDLTTREYAYFHFRAHATTPAGASGVPTPVDYEARKAWEKLTGKKIKR